jgi:hypothetical protein
MWKAFIDEVLLSKPYLEARVLHPKGFSITFEYHLFTVTKVFIFGACLSRAG